VNVPKEFTKVDYRPVEVVESKWDGALGHITGAKEHFTVTK
jgi:hypothetical protein